MTDKEIILINTDDAQSDMLPEYDFSQVQLNRFAKSLSIELDLDIGGVF